MMEYSWGPKVRDGWGLGNEGTGRSQVASIKVTSN